MVLAEGSCYCTGFSSLLRFDWPGSHHTWGLAPGPIPLQFHRLEGGLLNAFPVSIHGDSEGGGSSQHPASLSFLHGAQAHSIGSESGLRKDFVLPPGSAGTSVQHSPVSLQFTYVGFPLHSYQLMGPCSEDSLIQNSSAALLYKVCVSVTWHFVLWHIWPVPTK